MKSVHKKQRPSALSRVTETSFGAELHPAVEAAGVTCGSSWRRPPRSSRGKGGLPRKPYSPAPLEPNPTGSAAALSRPCAAVRFANDRGPEPRTGTLGPERTKAQPPSGSWAFKVEAAGVERGWGKANGLACSELQAPREVDCGFQHLSWLRFRSVVGAARQVHPPSGSHR